MERNLYYSFGTNLSIYRGLKDKKIVQETCKHVLPEKGSIKVVGLTQLVRPKYQGKFAVKVCTKFLKENRNFIGGEILIQKLGLIYLPLQ
jgi:hypothetical protein